MPLAIPFKRLTLAGLVASLCACGGGSEGVGVGGDVGPGVVVVDPIRAAATVVITSDAVNKAAPTVITASFDARIVSVATDFIVMGGNCTKTPVPVSVLDSEKKTITVRVSGAVCEPGQTLTVAVDPSKIVLENAALANTAVWTQSYTITATSQKLSGSIRGLFGTIVLRSSTGETVTVSGNGDFEFPTPISIGSIYSITVDTQPSGFTCSISNGGGFVGTNPLAKLVVTCAEDVYAYNIAGTVTGLTGTLQLANNGGDLKTLNANGPFSFSLPVVSGAPYAVTVLAQPLNQTCTVTNGSGVMVGPVNNVSVVCSINAYTVGGNVSGLVGTVELLNNGADALALTSNGAFTFSTPVAVGAPYTVTIGTQPINQICSVTNGTGTIVASPVTNVGLQCASINVNFVAGNTYTGTNGIDNVYTGPMAGLSGSTITGNAGDVDELIFTTAGAVTLNNGTSGGILSNIKKVTLANGNNTLGFANSASGITTVTGGTGDDSVNLTNTGATFLAGTVNLGDGTNSLILENKVYTGTFTAGVGASDTLFMFNGTNISGADVTGFENLTLSNNATVTMSTTEFSQFIGVVTANGTETVNFSTAGTIVASTSIEKYNLANGTNDFTSTNVAVSAIGGSGSDTFTFSANRIVNFLTTIDGGIGSDTLNIGATTTQSINLSTKVTGFETINVNGSTGTVSFTNVNGGGVTLNYSKLTGDTVLKLGSGGQTLNVNGTSSASTTITGGTGADSIRLMSAGGGNDIIVATGAEMSNMNALDTVANFNASGTDKFQTGVAGGSYLSTNIGAADLAGNAYLTAIGTAVSNFATTNSDVILIQILSGTAAGFYLFENIGSDLNNLDAGDFLVRLTGTIGTVGGASFIN